MPRWRSPSQHLPIAFEGRWDRNALPPARCGSIPSRGAAPASPGRERYQNRARRSPTSRRLCRSGRRTGSVPPVPSPTIDCYCRLPPGEQRWRRPTENPREIGDTTQDLCCGGPLRSWLAFYDAARPGFFPAARCCARFPEVARHSLPGPASRSPRPAPAVTPKDRSPQTASSPSCRATTASSRPG